MENNKALDELLAQQKNKSKKPDYKTCTWRWTLLTWGERDTEKMEVVISKDEQKIADYLAQFDDPANWDKEKPRPIRSGGFDVHASIHTLTAGSIRGPQRGTVIKEAKVPKTRRRGLIIINLDKE